MSLKMAQRPEVGVLELHGKVLPKDTKGLGRGRASFVSRSTELQVAPTLLPGVAHRPKAVIEHSTYCLVPACMRGQILRGRENTDLSIHSRPPKNLSCLTKRNSQDGSMTRSEMV